MIYREIEYSVVQGVGRGVWNWSLLMVKGPGSPEVRAIYSRAVALKGSEDSSARFKALWGLWYYSMSSGRLSEAAAHAAELLRARATLGR